MDHGSGLEGCGSGRAAGSELDAPRDPDGSAGRLTPACAVDPRARRAFAALSSWTDAGQGRQRAAGAPRRQPDFTLSGSAAHANGGALRHSAALGVPSEVSRGLTVASNPARKLPALLRLCGGGLLVWRGNGGVKDLGGVRDSQRGVRESRRDARWRSLGRLSRRSEHSHLILHGGVPSGARPGPSLVSDKTYPWPVGTHIFGIFISTATIRSAPQQKTKKGKSQSPKSRSTTRSRGRTLAGPRLQPRAGPRRLAAGPGCRRGPSGGAAAPQRPSPVRRRSMRSSLGTSPFRRTYDTNTTIAFRE